MTSLRSRLSTPEIVVAPGCYDGLSGCHRLSATCQFLTSMPRRVRRLSEALIEKTLAKILIVGALAQDHRSEGRALYGFPGTP